MSAAWPAASVPRRPMATPMCAALSAGTSLTPSPVMAAISPSRLSASTIRTLCSGTTRAKTLTRRTASRSSSSTGVELGPGEHLAGVDAGGGGDAGRRARVVAGDHDRADPGSPRLLDARPRRRSRGVGEADEPEGFEGGLGVLARRRRVTSGDEQDAQAVLGPAADDRRDALPPGSPEQRHQDLGRALDAAGATARPGRRSTTPIALALGVERRDLDDVATGAPRA